MNYIKQAVAACWAAIAWFSERLDSAWAASRWGQSDSDTLRSLWRHCMHPASQRPGT